MVIAKAPEAGKVKTRLSPPLAPHEVLAIAWACLLETLDAACRLRAQRHVLVLDGPAGEWIPPGFEVIPQRGSGLGARLAHAFEDVEDDAIVIAMDTPQVTTELLHEALAALEAHDAVVGPASDGGYWLIGLRRSVDAAAVFEGVEMSTDHTGADQLARLGALGLRTGVLSELRDIDTFEDLAAVAAMTPSSRVSAAFERLGADVTGPPANDRR